MSTSEYSYVTNVRGLDIFSLAQPLCSRTSANTDRNNNELHWELQLNSR